MNLGAAQALWERDPEKARSKLDAAAALSKQTQNELTALISTLRPAQLEGRGLAGALEEYLSTWQRNTGIQAQFETRGSGQLPPEYEQALFRIAQEGLANIAKHSRAREARLTLEFENSQVSLEISDDGCGFDMRQPAKGLGLQSMRERAQALGGELRLQSGSQGTRLTAVIPRRQAGEIGQGTG
jgi:signal transduction histidine kinase